MEESLHCPKEGDVSQAAEWIHLGLSLGTPLEHSQLVHKAAINKHSQCSLMTKANREASSPVQDFVPVILRR